MLFSTGEHVWKRSCMWKNRNKCVTPRSLLLHYAYPQGNRRDFILCNANDFRQLSKITTILTSFQLLIGLRLCIALSM